jgi:hypothetical protein
MLIVFCKIIVREFEKWKSILESQNKLNFDAGVTMNNLCDCFRSKQYFFNVRCIQSGLYILIY